MLLSLYTGFTVQVWYGTAHRLNPTPLLLLSDHTPRYGPTEAVFTLSTHGNNMHRGMSNCSCPLSDELNLFMKILNLDMTGS